MTNEQKIMKRIKIAVVAGTCALFILVVAVVAGFATIGAKKAEKARLEARAIEINRQIELTKARTEYFKGENGDFIEEYLMYLGFGKKYDPLHAE
jgi:hypothetical protein